MANRKQRRRILNQRRRATQPEPLGDSTAGGEPIARLTYTREEAAQALGISLATLDRRVIPAITTISTEWGRRLVPAAELDRYLAARSEQPRPQAPDRNPRGRPPALPADVVDRIRNAHALGRSLGSIARELNHDRVPTAQGGRQWWPSTVRAVLERIRRK